MADIAIMSKINITDVLSVNNIDSLDATRSAFKSGLTNLYGYHISVMLDTKLAKISKEKIINDYVSTYNSYVANMRMKYALYNNNDINDEILSEYVSNYSALRYHEAQIEFYERAIERNEIEIKDRARQLEEHQMLINSFRAKYDEIEELYCTMRKDMEALLSVKDKIKHNEEFIKYMIEVQNEKVAGKVIGNGNNTSCMSSFSSALSNSGDSSILSTSSMDTYHKWVFRSW